MHDQQKGCTFVQKGVTFLPAALLIVFLLFSLAACTRGLGKGPPTRHPLRSIVAKSIVGEIEIKFSVDKHKFSKQEKIVLNLVIINTSEKPTTLSFSNSQSHDFLIKNAGSSLVWKWSHGRVFAQSFMSKRLRSGDQMKIKSIWDQKTDKNKPVPVGKYRLEAEFYALGQPAKIGPIGIIITE